MNTEICRYIFDPTEDSEYHHGTQCCVSPVNFVHSRETGVPKAPGVDLHVQRVSARSHEVAS